MYGYRLEDITILKDDAMHVKPTRKNMVYSV